MAFIRFALENEIRFIQTGQKENIQNLSTIHASIQFKHVLCVLLTSLKHVILVLIALAINDYSGETVQMLSLARAFAARTHKVWM